MKLLHIALTKIVVAAIIMGLISFTCSTLSYADKLAEYQERVRKGTGMPTPGYVRVDEERSSVDKLKPRQGFLERTMNYINNKLGARVAEPAADKVKPYLKMKTSDEAASDLTASINAGVQNITYTPEGTLIETITNDYDQIIYETYLNNGVETRYIYVSNDSAYAYSSIQDAVNKARNDSGDVVLVKAGTYSNVSVDLSRRSDISIIGENAYSTILDNIYSAAFISRRNSSGNYNENITIKNLTFEGLAGDSHNYAVKIFGSGYSTGFTIENNIIRNLTTGILLTNVRKEGHVIRNNLVENCNTGIATSTDTLIENNIIRNNVDALGDSYNSRATTSYYLNDNYIYGNADGNKAGGALNENAAQSNTFVAPPEGIQSTVDRLPQTLSWDGKDLLSQSDSLYNPADVSIDGVENLLSMFNGLLANRENLTDEQGKLDPAMIADLIEGAILQDSALSMSAGGLTQKDVEIAMLLANILKDPTKDQKIMLGVLEDIMTRIGALDEKDREGAELQRAKEEFTTIVVTLLLAQALPNLLEAGEMTLVKGLFTQLSTEKTKILTAYQTSVNTYYDGIRKELASNMNALRLKDIIKANLTERDLKQLSHNRIDEILRKIARMKDKTKSEEHILAKHEEYSEKYLKPAKETLEHNMTTLLSIFSRRILSLLDRAGLVKDGAVVLSKEE